MTDPRSVPTETTELNLEQRFALKETMIEMRKEIEATQRSADYPYARVTMFDLEAMLDEIDRLMIVNSEIAKLLCDAQDRLSPDPSSLPSNVREAIDEFKAAAIGEYVAIKYMQGGNYDPGSAMVRIAAARSNLESLFLKQQREIESLASRSPTADPEKDFEKLLDEIESFAKVLGRVEFCWERDENVPTYQMEAAQKDFSAARQSLVDYVRLQEHEISTLANWTRELSAELASLRERVLTESDAQRLIAIIESTPMKYPPEITELYKRLRRISSGVTEKE